jgi:phospholipase/lecithinase/hemolysin
MARHIMRVAQRFGGCLLFVILVIFNSSSMHQPAFDQLVVFGDSLSDIGNAGRFSNGPVWTERLAKALGLSLRPSDRGGQNFAVGGALVEVGPHSLRAQVDKFLKLTPPPGSTLYIVWGGANDVFAAMDQPDPLTDLNAAAASLQGIVTDLIAHGASDLLVPNLPDVGITPEIRAKGSKTVEEAGRLTQHLNLAVESKLKTLRPSTTKYRLYHLDVAAMARQALSDPESFGLSDTSTPCRESGRCRNHLFWDQIHPTTDAHARLAEAALDTIALQPTR